MRLIIGRIDPASSVARPYITLEDTDDLKNFVGGLRIALSACAVNGLCVPRAGTAVIVDALPTGIRLTANLSALICAASPGDLILTAEDVLDEGGGPAVMVRHPL